MSLEDLLDLYSVFSENCPDNVRASWAFHIYDCPTASVIHGTQSDNPLGTTTPLMPSFPDFDGDNQISLSDLMETVNRLTWSYQNEHSGIDVADVEHVARMQMECSVAEQGRSPTVFQQPGLRVKQFGIGIFFYLYSDFSYLADNRPEGFTWSAHVGSLRPSLGAINGRWGHQCADGPREPHLGGEGFLHCRLPFGGTFPSSKVTDSLTKGTPLVKSANYIWRTPDFS
ncbi:hypothetical protein WN48_08648 [Eufriesea mexicana]|uniref:EF-hand domain-containing protein n=1 Tax=Eufriesea mexicana TaxID=516756 RepID=A0A310SHX0_9HYME|nr:hypothetical protein WN48_08648 [Eufriesea mexicana]